MAASKHELRLPGFKGEEPYLVGHHWVSSFNFEARLKESLSFAKPLKLYDSTLRKILLTPGVSPSVEELMDVAEALQDLGVREMVLNLHWWGDPTPNLRESALLRAVLSHDFDFHVTAYAEAAVQSPGSNVSPRDALYQVRELGAETVELPFQGQGAAAVEIQLDALKDSFAYARSIGLNTVLGIGDVGRRDFDTVVEIAEEAIALGCSRINLLDSYSSLSVEGMKLLCSSFRRRLSRPVEVSMHVHNDFGLGTALALAAAASGVNPDVSVNSVSYRAGFAALQEVAVALELLYGQPTGIRLAKLQGVADLVNRHAGLPAMAMQPLTGAHAFLRDDPEAILEYLQDGPEAYPESSSCIAPAAVGATMTVVWGDRHATSTVRAKLDQLGISADEALVKAVYRRIEEGVNSLTAYPRWLTEDEVEKLCIATSTATVAHVGLAGDFA